jgi:hypothetical protein
MDKSIDPFNIFGIEYIEFTNEFYDFCKTYINVEELNRYTVDFDYNYIDLVGDLLVDKNIKEIATRIIYYICGKLSAKVGTKEWLDVWAFDNLKVNLKDIIKTDKELFAHINRYKSGQTYMTYIFNICIAKKEMPDIISGEIAVLPCALVSYKNNI